MKNWQDLKAFAESQNFVVTSTTGGKHNRGSKHFLGLAIDVRTRDKSNEQIEAFTRKAKAIGIRVIDERKRPSGQAVWGGAHLHLDIGAQTLDTVHNFQRRNNLTADGIVGRETVAVLDALF